MRGSRDTFELLIERQFENDGTVLRWISRRFQVDRAIQIRATWGGGHCDARRLGDFIERLIGGTLYSWAELGVREGHEMAVALMPFWEREVFRYMEHMERDAFEIRRPERYRGMRPDRFIYDDWLGGVDWAKPEDPKAKEKARQLLLRNLDAGQEKSFKADGSFRVTAKDRKVYTIKTARSFNVVAEDGTKYCGQLRDTPVEDQMLAQKLLLEHEPEKFFKNANVSPGSGATTAGTGTLQAAINTGTIRRARDMIYGNWDTGI